MRLPLVTNRSSTAFSYEPASSDSSPSTSPRARKSEPKRSFVPIAFAVCSTALFVHFVDRTALANPDFTSVSFQARQDTQSVSSPTNHQSQGPGLDDPQPDAPWPRIAWLLSFPNSGTTYTGHMVMETTNTTTATNYGMESEWGDNVPVFDGQMDGPWWRYPDQPRPSRESYVMTKTHCGGRCTICRPESYIETTRSFHVACRSGSRHGFNGTKELVTYHDNVVHRAIHLLRNPFDNLVSRLHMERKNWEVKGNRNGKLGNFSSDKEGLKAWCKFIDDLKEEQEMESRFIDTELFEMEKKLSCHAEFFRYIQWHNQAIEVTRKMQLPVYYLYYENYTTNFDETVSQVLGFLRLDKVKDAPLFIKGKEYYEYFEPEERRLVAKLFKELSSIEAWEYIRHYVEHYL